MALRLIARGSLSQRFASVMSMQFSTSQVSCGDEPGKGSGKGGGSGGAIREAGGAFGKREAAQEDQYFRKLQQDQLSKIKTHLKDEISHHEEELKHHREAIERHKEKLEELQKKEKE